MVEFVLLIGVKRLDPPHIVPELVHALPDLVHLNRILWLVCAVAVK